MSARARPTASRVAARRAGARLHCEAQSSLPGAASFVCERAALESKRYCRVATARRPSQRMPVIRVEALFPFRCRRSQTQAASLSSYVFVVARPPVLFGWEVAGALLAAVGALTQLLQHRPGPFCVTYNAAGFKGAAALARTVDRLVPNTRRTSASSVLGAGIAAVRGPPGQPAPDHAQVAVRRGDRSSPSPASGPTRSASIIPFALMASAGGPDAGRALAALRHPSRLRSSARCWRSPSTSAHVSRASRAMRLALTDPLTGLGNHRHFHERLQRERRKRRTRAERISLLAFVDIDDFKRINDQYGPPQFSDRVLSQIAASPAEARRSASAATSSARAPRSTTTRRCALEAARRVGLAIMELDYAEQVTVSAGGGVPASRTLGRGRADPLRGQRALLGEGARQGTASRSTAPRGRRVGRTEEASRAAPTAPRAPRRQASLARAVDARDVYEGSHSERANRAGALARTPHGLAQGAKSS